jgi:hypothetical protein
MVKSINRRLTKLEAMPELSQARRIKTIERDYSNAVRSGTGKTFLASLPTQDLLSWRDHLHQDTDINWAAIPTEQLELAAQNKITTQELRRKYPLKEVTSS